MPITQVTKKFLPAHKRRRWYGPALFIAGGTLLSLVITAPGPRQPAEANTSLDARPAADTPRPAGSISFNRDIRPILSENCFACHGPDAAVSKDAGGFRLDTFETATVPATSGEIPIVPGDADASTVIKRVLSKSANLQMPPPKSHLKLTADQVALLKQWIDEGAKYEGHWAYQTPVKPELPKLTDDNKDWARNAVDHFIAAKLQAAGLSPSEQADKPTLIRRLSLDLVGLPPTPQEIDAFVNDTSDNAYDKLVDRLLDSPHFGERLALIWLDAARYADTIGYQLDHYRSSWPYRNYVIDSFNNNKPYNEFLVEQLAGDMLPGATDEQKLATAFCRLHMMNHEGGSIDEEFRVEAVSDRIETISTVFMAQTFNCAKCHDHKYDPTTQDDYFSLFKYFHSVNERGVWTNKPEHAIAYGDRLDWYTPEQKTALTDAQATLKQAEQAWREASKDTLAQQAAWETTLQKKHGVHWAQTKLVDAKTSQVDGTIERKPDGSVLLNNRDSPGSEDLTLKLETQATGLRLMKLDALTDDWNGGRVGRADSGDAQPTYIKVTATSLRDPKQQQIITFRYAWATQSELGNDRDALNLLKPGRPGWGTATDKDKNPRTLLLVADEPFGYDGGTALSVFIEHKSGLSRRTLGRVRVGFAQAGASVLEAFPVVMEGWYEAGPFVADSFDKAFTQAFGPEKQTTPIKPGDAGGGKKWLYKPKYTADKDHSLVRRESAFYLGTTVLSPIEQTQTLRLGHINGLRVFNNNEEVLTHRHTADQKSALNVKIKLHAGENRIVLKIVNTQDEPTFFNWQWVTPKDAPLPQSPLSLIPQDQRTVHGQAALTKQWQTGQSPHATALAKAKRQVAQIKAQSTPITIMKELSKPKPMFVLERGEYNKPIKDRPVTLHLPSIIDLPLPKGAPNNRLGFAMWLVRDDHPLTARVHVNRFWQMLFGTGIVATLEDFGSQADWPSHPGLLDYLAVDFVQSGWDQKALIKQIVMSATYRQRATRQAQATTLDPGNRLLSYFPRRRLPGELIRDQAIAAAGLLSATIGGPSVKPYQPAGLWREVSMGPRSNTNVFKRDDGDKLYRRSLYTFIKRKAPPPQLAIFGTPNRESCTVQRDLTNTPLQALTLWNDEQFLEAARVLAQRTLAEAKTDDDRFARLLIRCTGQAPGEAELIVLRDALSYYRARYADHAADAKALLTQGEHPLPETYDPAELASWMMIANTVLSLDATVVRD